MRISLDGHEAYAYTGGRVFNPALPADNTFDPLQAGTGSNGDRFRRPSGFTVTILHNSSE